MVAPKNSEKCEAPGTRKGAVWSQWLAGLVLSVAIVVSGMANGWISPYLAQLTSDEMDPALRLTDDEGAWVASLLNLGRLLGAPLCVILQDLVGRKKTLLIGGVPIAASWIFNIYSTSVYWLYAARFCSGVGSGIIWPALPLYLAEIAHPRIRGSVISMNVNASSVGMFLGNVMGPYLSMEMFAYVSLVPNILFVVLFSLIPESPYHYVLHNDIEKAEASLKWFRREADVKAEIQELKDFVDGAGTNVLLKLKQFGLPANLKNSLIMFCLNVFVYLTGYGTINAYAEKIVISCQTNLTPSTVVMMMGFSTMVAGLTTILAVDRLGRRCFLMVSSLGVAISLAFLGLHFHLLSLDFDPQGLSWLPIVSLVSFNIFMASGLVPVPSSLLGELFPANLKNLAAFGVASTNSLLAFMSTRTYQPYLDLVGEKYVFWTYSILGFAAVPFVYYLVPETKGKTLLEIQKSRTVDRSDKRQDAQ